MRIGVISKKEGYASPGFPGLLEATGVNASKAIVDHAVEKAKAGM